MRSRSRRACSNGQLLASRARAERPVRSGWDDMEAGGSAHGGAAQGVSRPATLSSILSLSAARGEKKDVAPPPPLPPTLTKARGREGEDKGEGVAARHSSPVAKAALWSAHDPTHHPEPGGRRARPRRLFEARLEGRGAEGPHLLYRLHGGDPDPDAGVGPVPEGHGKGHGAHREALLRLQLLGPGGGDALQADRPRLVHQPVGAGG